ncbi:dal80p-controlled protein [Yamadazyma tenuis]|uniref:Uncharacterized protein n=1 Tax=Candida tenuis (strain ATCC 10573 / BCRC 21748 / CBS 615 / JCM 9827 / NBRC 10315 / NRRL Y-1498 / VKM Y-70) TaxID=590646 RepID=G3AY85_CANTC|nr:uncharacterized protein CANTEDRAFT_112661 [Yamadazyma tenuis ATCC 10573]EGV65791.1 hypothetical protein CANTEDRAFT_112661 [Yamadazyma tenuis ATCC 10573]WEJ95884.1 dal80p-controlled protein [Yamadazyma tenuis]
MYKLLVINPNSSEKVTNDMRDLLPQVPGIQYDFYTAPAAAPSEIDGEHAGEVSEAVVYPDLIKRKLLDYDGYLVCCYSDHPLVYSLTQSTNKPILGIMLGSLIYSVSNPRFSKSMILTSTSSWNNTLDKSILKFFKSHSFPQSMARTKSFDINVVNLNNPVVYGEIVKKVQLYLDEEPQVNCVLLGCAGMVGLDSKLAKTFPDVRFIDSVRVSAEILASLVRFETS